MPPTQTRAQRDAEQVGAFLDQLFYAITGGPTVKDRNAGFAKFRRAAVSVVRRDGEPNVVDGYKSRHGDTSGGGGNSELTPVERAALQLLRGVPSDEVHLAASLIVTNAPRAYNSVVAIANQVRRVPAEPGAPAPEAAVCSHCREFPGELETTVNGALAAAYFLCARCIAYVERQGNARVGRHGARLPDAVWLEQQRTGKAPLKRVDPKTKPYGFNNADGSRSYTGLSADRLPPSAA